jgi:hypothetical protein
LILRQRLGSSAEAVTLQPLMICRSRSFCTRSAITIAFSVLGKSGSPSAIGGMLSDLIKSDGACARRSQEREADG